MNYEHSKFWLLFFFVLAFLLNGNTILNEYSLDDHYVTFPNEMVVKGIHGLPEIFTSNYINIGNVKVDYRPLVKASFAIEYEFFEGNPHIGHFFNVLLYAINCALLFLLLSLLLKSYSTVFPVLITLLFTAHPIHTEVVVSLKNRDELLAFLFGLSCAFSLIAYAKRKDYLYMAMGGLFLLLGLLSKASILPFVVIIPLTLWFFRLSKFSQAAQPAVFMVLLVLIYYTVLFSFLPVWDREYLYIEKPFSFEQDMGIKTASIVNALGYYLKLLIFPHSLSFYYGFNQIPLVHWGKLGPIISLLAYLSMITYAVVSIRKRSLVAFGILLLLIPLVLVANIFYGIAGIIAERALFLSSLGFCFLLGFGLLKVSRVDFTRGILDVKKWLVPIALVLPIFILYSFKTIKRNSEWKDHVTLMSADIDHLENSAKANQLYAYHLLLDAQEIEDPLKKSEMIQEVIEHYLKSIEIYDQWDLVHRQLGLVFARDANHPELAIHHFKRAIELDSNSYKAAYNLGQCYELLGQPDSATKYYQFTLGIVPKHPHALSKMELYYLSTGDTATALTYRMQRSRHQQLNSHEHQ